jgi:cell wall-associated NlpC family hydrolase
MPAGLSIRTVCAGAMIVCSLVLAGCSSSSPRFVSGHRDSSSPPARHGPRFSSKEAEEESRENDRKVDPKEIEKIASGTRDFRREKNPAIPPLNESRLMREISRYMGVPYQHGGASTEGMDCSGYTMTVYKNGAGVQLPRTSRDQAEVGSPIGTKDLKFGDLVFFNTTGTDASHVGIYLGDDLFAHASVTLGVTISSLQSSYYQRRLDGARRIIGK